MAIALIGEVALPTNPNCICYFADARLALIQPWLKIQRAAWDGLERFHSASGIDAFAYFGRRVSLSRRNEASSNITLMYVFDGPASKEQVELFDEAARTSAISWSSSSVEPLPPHAFPSLAVKSGKFYQLWLETRAGPRASRFGWKDGHVELEHLAPETATARDFIPYVRHVVATRPHMHATDRDLEALKVAFAYEFSRRIVNADGVVVEEEASFLAKVFPADLLSRMGLDDDAVRQTYWRRSVEELPVQLGHHEKLALIGLFFAACHSDGTLSAVEMRVLKEAAVVLGVDKNDVVDYLRRIW